MSRMGVRTYYFEIDGGQRCHDAPPTCDLHSGVDTDDRTGRITFHLLQPDPSFLYKLAEPFLVVATPPGVPLTKPVSSPMPSTGPYIITSYAPRKDVVLSRNPCFARGHMRLNRPVIRTRSDGTSYRLSRSKSMMYWPVKRIYVDLDDADETLTDNRATQSPRNCSTSNARFRTRLRLSQHPGATLQQC